MAFAAVISGQTSTTNGNWTSGATWVGGVSPSEVIGSGDFVTIAAGDTVTINSAMLEVRNNGVLFVYGYLIVDHADGLEFFNGCTVTIFTGGTIKCTTGEVRNNSTGTTLNGSLICTGDFTAGNGSSISGTGTMITYGTLTVTGSGTVMGSGSGCTGCELTTSGTAYVFYVATTGDDSNSGNDPSAPKLTISSAITATTADGTRIEIADGTYNENDMDIDYSTTFQGTSEAGTIIDNDDVSGEYCFKVTTDGVDISLKNLTIRDFRNSAGPALYTYERDNKVVMENVTVNSCYVNDVNYDGAVFIFHDAGAGSNDSIVIKNCTFSDNYSADDSYGSALTVQSYSYDYDYPILIESTTFDNNDGVGSYDYGAVYLRNGHSAVVRDCIFKNNSSHYYGTALQIRDLGSSSGSSDRMTIENCLFHDNAGSQATLRTEDADGDIYNCTFAQNTASMTYYYAANLEDESGSSNIIKNCIFDGSDDTGNYNIYSYGTVSNSVIYSGYSNAYTDGGSNSTSDPLFSDGANNDFTLTSASPAIDAGTSGGPAADILGVTRDGSPDMGCYEYSPNNWTGTTSSAWANSSNWSRGTVPGTSENITIPDVSSGSGNDPIITSDVTLGGITINSGASLTISSNSLTVTGTMDINDNLYIDNATVNVDGTFDATGGTIDFTNANGKLILSSTVTSLGNNLDAEMGTVEYDGATQNVLADTYSNLSISTTGTKTATGNLDVNGNLTTAATASCKLDLSSYDLNLGGNLIVGATDGLDVSDASCSITMNGANDQTITHAGVTAGSSTATLYLTSSGGSYHSEKWLSVTTGVNNTGTTLWAQGNGTIGNGAGLITDQPLTVTKGTTYYVNAFDKYDDSWDGTSWFLHTAVSLGGTQVATLSDPDDAANTDATSSWDETTDELEASTSFTYLTAPSSATFKDFAINKASGNVILDTEISVDGVLTFTSGDIDASSNTLTLTSSATVSGGTDASHVLGAMVKTTEATSKFTFPIGDGTQYKAISITPQNGTSTEWTAKYFNTAYSSTTLSVSNAADIDHVSTYEYWDLARTGSDAAIVEIPWVPLNDVQSFTELRLAHWDGSGWENIPASTAGGSNASGNLTSTGYQSSFSPFTLGSSTTTNVLPIELVSFSGEKKDNRNILNWTTASEINNAYFTIEKSYNGIDFEWVGTQEGSSPSTQIRNYSLTDYNILETLNYYRLKQTDFDGKFEYSKTISLDNRVDNSFKEIIGRTNLLGQEVDEFYNGIVIVRYKDGTSQKFYQFK